MKTVLWRLSGALAIAGVLAWVSPTRANTVGGAPSIPEPMVFDMIRSLASPGGKVEGNLFALAPIAADGEKADGAAELKISVADGWGVEFDAPFKDERFIGATAAVQGTFGTLANKRAVHGFQALATVREDTGQLDISALYILGVRYSPRWSTLSMVGVNRSPIGSEFNAPRENKLLVNNTLFNDLGPNTTIGIETNFRLGNRSTEWLVMPQVHQRLTKKAMLLVGFGLQKPAFRDVHPTLAFRFVREL